MRDDDDRAAPRQQVLGEPADALDVEVVGRLVEHDQVGVADQRRGQRDAPLLAAGQARRRCGRGRCMPSPSRTSRTCGSAAHSCSAAPTQRGQHDVAHPGALRAASSPCARCARRSPPSRLTRPPSGARRPVRMSSSVVLPPPLSPTTPIRSPALDAERHASSSTREASPGTCAVTVSRLTRFWPAASGAHRRPAAGGGPAGGSCWSTTRAPGTGPCATRTVRHTPTPGQLGGHVERGVGARAQERAGRARSRRRARRARPRRPRPAACGAGPGPC